MPQQAQNQSVTSQSTTPHPNQPQPTNNKPDAFARLAEAVDRTLKRLNHPKAEKSSAPKGTRPSRPATVSQAKNYLRATRPPKFLNPNRSLERHARKCAICHHPEREMIEELFVHWHSPQSIVDFLADYDNVNWVSIYRHAYVLGLDTVRRCNLGFVFENILDNAADATPTAAGVIAAARALSCVNSEGRWVEPPKRILMTTLVRKQDPASITTSTEQKEPDVPLSASFRERLEGRGSASTSPRANSRGCPSVENSVPVASSSLPEAAFYHPARSASHSQVQEAALSASSLPEAAFDAPAAAQRTSPPGIPSAVHSGTREIRLPLNSRQTKDKRISNR